MCCMPTVHQGPVHQEGQIQRIRPSLCCYLQLPTAKNPCSYGMSLYFFSSTSTYSASITPSSFFGSSADPACAVGSACWVAVALYIASASLWLTLVRRSRV